MELEVNGKQEVVTGSRHEGGSLLHRTTENLEHKNFETEVRGLLDVKSLLDTCTFLLDVKV